MKPDLKAARKIGKLIDEALRLAPSAQLTLEITIKPAAGKGK